MDLLIFILCCYGLTQIVVYGEIFKKIREIKYFKKLLSCAMCSSFWIGGMVYLLLYISGIKLLSINIFVGFLIYSSISSATSYFLCSVIGDEGLRIEKKQNK